MIQYILLKKKEIDDKIPILRTPDDKKMLKSLFNKMRKFPKDLIAEIKNKQVGPSFMGPLQVWPMVCGCRGSKNVTYRQQTTDKKVNTEPL